MYVMMNEVHNLDRENAEISIEEKCWNTTDNIINRRVRRKTLGEEEKHERNSKMKRKYEAYE